MRKLTRRRRLSMTSLIDIIFLLLLFFMLSSTFSRFAEVEIAAAGGGDPVQSSGTKPSFVQLGQDSLSVNGQDADLASLSETFAGISPDTETLPVLVSLKPEVTAQRLTDVLIVLRSIDRLRINVLGS